MTTEDSILNLNTIEPNPDTSSSLNTEITIRKKLIPDYFPVRTKVITTSKMVQVNLENGPSDDNLSSGLSENYWRLVAEKKRIDLKNALDENEILCNQKDLLVQQLKRYKEMLAELHTFVDVLKSEVLDAANDTGIDVGDESGD